MKTLHLVITTTKTLHLVNYDLFLKMQLRAILEPYSISPLSHAFPPDFQVSSKELVLFVFIQAHGRSWVNVG